MTKSRPQRDRFLRQRPEDAIRAVPEAQDLKRAEILLREPDAWREVVSDEELGHRLSIYAAREDPSSYAEHAFDYQQQAFHVGLQDVLSAYRKVSIDAPVEHGKSTQASVIRPLWELGRNPSHQVLLVGNSTEIPYKCFGQIRSTIQDNEAHHEVFPELELLRSTENVLVVRRPSTRVKDHSVEAVGITGSIYGGRFTIEVWDDILSPRNVMGVGRRRVWDLIQDVLLRRVMWGGSIWDVGTPWFEDDARHRIRRMKGWVYVCFDSYEGQYYVVRRAQKDPPGGTQVKIRGAKPGHTLWQNPYTDPESGQRFGWPIERLEEAREDMTLAAHARQFRSKTLSDAFSTFPPTLITRALELGKGRGAPRLLQPLQGVSVVTGVDLATRRSKESHLTVLITGFSSSGRAVILDIRSGHWEQPGIAREVRELVSAYPTHAGFTVEDNAAQVYLVQLLQDRQALRGWGWSDIEMQRLRVTGSNTTSVSKWDERLGVKAMAKEFELDRLELPSDEFGSPVGEMEHLASGLMNFDPDPAAHTSDYVMALWLFFQACRVNPSSQSDYGIGSTKG